jgi:hypothetical protein
LVVTVLVTIIIFERTLIVHLFYNCAILKLYINRGETLDGLSFLRLKSFLAPLGTAAFRHVVVRGDNETKGGGDRLTEELIRFCDPNAEIPTSEAGSACL